MRKSKWIGSLTFLFVCVFSMACMSINVQAEENYKTTGSNLVADGSFEEHTAFDGDSPWKTRITGNSGMNQGLGIDSNPTGQGYSEPQDGVSNVFLVAADPNLTEGAVRTIWQDVTVEANTQYEFAFYVKKWAAGNIVGPIVYGISDPAAEDPFAFLSSGEYSNAGGAYRKVDLAFDSGAHTALRVMISLTAISFEQAQNYTTGYHLDSVSLYKTVPDEVKQCVQDGSFEAQSALDGSSSPWFAQDAVSQGQSAPGIGIDFFGSNAGAHTGNGNIFLVSADDYLPAGMHLALYQDITVEKNTDYAFSFWAKKWADGNIVSPLQYGVLEPNGGKTVEARESAEITGVYTEVRLLFHSGDRTTVRIYVGLDANRKEDNAGFNCGYHLDDFSVVEAEIGGADEMFEGESILTDGGLEESLSVARQEYSASAVGQWADIAPDLAQARVGVDHGLPNTNDGDGNLWLCSANQAVEKGTVLGVYQDVDVEADSWYRFSFFVKKWGDGNIVAPIGYAVIDPAATQSFGTFLAGDGFSGATGVYRQVGWDFFTGEHTHLRLAIYLSAISFEEAGYYETGYHIDDIELRRYATLRSVEFLPEEKAEVGTVAGYSVVGYFSNGEYVELPEEFYELRSSNSEVIEVHGDKLLLRSAGVAAVTPEATVHGVTVTGAAKEIAVSDPTDDGAAKEVTVSLDKEITTAGYSEILFELKLQNGASADAADITAEVYAGDPTVLNVYEKLGKYYVIARKQGTTEIDVLVRYRGTQALGILPVTVDDGNLLTDGSFEDADVTAWKIVRSSEGGHDFSNSGEYSRTGRGNLFFQAPAINENIRPDSTAYLYQDVEIEKAGYYSFSAYINRFEGNGKTQLGGLVKIGAVKLSGEEETEENSYTAAGISVGAGGYQQAIHTFEATEGTYRVYLLIEGDPVNGLGMQVDDCALREAVFATELKVKVGANDQVALDDMETITVTVFYEDGTQAVLSSGYTYEIEDPAIIGVSGMFVLGKKTGSTKLTVKATVSGRELSAEIVVSVIAQEGPSGPSEPSEPSGPSDPSGKEEGGCASTVGVSALWVFFGIGAFFFRKKHDN